MIENRTYILLAIIFFSLSSYAAPLTNWNAPDVIWGIDPAGENTITNNPPDNPARILKTGEDIVKVFYRYVAGIHYFRMDLLASVTFSNMSPEYSVQIDYQPGGLAHGDPTGNDDFSYYVAETLLGIDVMLTAHYSNGVFIGAVHRHRSNVSQPSNVDMTNLLTLSGGSFQSTEALSPAGVGATLEWSIAASELNGSGALDPIGMWMVTHDIDPGDGATYDIAPFVPETSSMVLLLAGAGIFILARFARVKNSTC